MNEREQLRQILGKHGYGKPSRANDGDSGAAPSSMPTTTVEEQNAPSPAGPQEPSPPLPQPSASDVEPEKPHDHTIAEDLLNLLRRFIVAEEFELHLIALWILLTHTFLLIGAAYAAYLIVCSAEKESGKTRVLEVLKWLVRMALMTASISPAALARTVHEEHCTLLLDECDTIYGPAANKELAEALRAIFNSGFKSDGTYTRMLGVGANMRPFHFSTFGCKALATIGLDKFPDTVLARSFVIRLKRALHGQCERFRPDGMSQSSKALRDELDKLRIRAAKWAQRHADQIANSQPVIPAEFGDRQTDISEAVFAIAQVLGNPWPERITQALSKLFASPAAEDTSKRVVLLGHIRKVFLDKFDSVEHSDSDKWALRTEDLIESLCGIAEAPWKEWNRGKPVTDRQLAKQLREFEIASSAFPYRRGGTRWNPFAMPSAATCPRSACA